VRVKPRLQTGAQQFLALQPSPIIPFGWYVPLAEPVRLKNRADRPAYLPFAFFYPTPIVPFGWFRDLDRPTRRLARVPEFPLLANAYFVSAPAEVVTIDKWFRPFS